MFYSRKNFPVVLVAAVCCLLNLAAANPVGERDLDSVFREARDNHKVSPMLDKMNVDTYLRNKKAVNQQIKCVLKDAPCDAVGKEIKKLIPMVLHDTNVCSECTENQLGKIRKIIDHLQTNYPKEWSEGEHRFGKPAGL